MREAYFVGTVRPNHDLLEADVPVLEEYWAGVLARVNAEVHTFSRLIRHAAEMGRENEAIFARLLERLLPRRYGVGTGMVIDSVDSYSRQTDIIVYNLGDQPTLFAQSTELMYPVEAVGATIEVKTRLGRDDPTDVGRKVRQLRELRPYREIVDGQADYIGELPYCAALAYSTRIPPATIVRLFGELDRVSQPDLLCVIDCGIVLCRNGELQGSAPGKLYSGVVLAHKRDDDGNRIAGSFEESHGEGSDHTIDGVDYLVEPARALLLFLQVLASALEARKPPRGPMLDLYMRDPVNEITPF